MSEELLPCPFCGGDAIFRPTEKANYGATIYNWDMVRCRKCGISIEVNPRFSDNPKQEAIQRWNDRRPWQEREQTND